ncbi:hypothetical protein Nepgr_030369 [Nepenthes gracilis]|uniref:Uncharacterized protein n=1 Tax=Nepenthes gracilis TaxID=150966 RepID=A0AAD3TG31_NEPGR|nr:hypothetical protein Nepgr_030369 [Nepenthes gracilis]
MAMVIPEPHDRALYPPDGFITVYEAHLKGGLRFSIPLDLYDVMRALERASRQASAECDEVSGVLVCLLPMS